MPPQGMPRPDKAGVDGLVSYLETSLDRAYAANPNPGRAMMHRLNRAEYANAIRDLLALDIDATALLPPDDESSGFDNIADVLEGFAIFDGAVFVGILEHQPRSDRG